MSVTQFVNFNRPEGAAIHSREEKTNRVYYPSPSILLKDINVVFEVRFASSHSAKQEVPTLNSDLRLYTYAHPLL